MLYEILVAPLSRVPSLHPLIVHVQQCQMITAWTKEVYARVVCVYHFILGTVENGVVH